MTRRDAPVDWSEYAETYDLLLEYNPFYQALHAEVLGHTAPWSLPPGARILDLGAGTGNYSLALAARFPEAHVVHVDRDATMNARAEQKRAEQGLDNVEIRTAQVEDLAFPDGHFAAAVCVHAFYTFPSPPEVMARLHRWLAPGAPAVFVDAGRVVKVLDWQIAVGSAMVRTHGLKKTIEVMRRGKEVSRQNRKISELQRDGTYWTHAHQEFVDAVSGAGFAVQAAGTTFRGISDWVTVTR